MTAIVDTRANVPTRAEVAKEHAAKCDQSRCRWKATTGFGERPTATQLAWQHTRSKGHPTSVTVTTTTQFNPAKEQKA